MLNNVFAISFSCKIRLLFYFFYFETVLKNTLLVKYFDFCKRKHKIFKVRNLPEFYV